MNNDFIIRFKTIWWFSGPGRLAKCCTLKCNALKRWTVELDWKCTVLWFWVKVFGLIFVNSSKSYFVLIEFVTLNWFVRSGVKFYQFGGRKCSNTVHIILLTVPYTGSFPKNQPQEFATTKILSHFIRQFIVPSPNFRFEIVYRR